MAGPVGGRDLPVERPFVGQLLGVGQRVGRRLQGGTTHQHLASHVGGVRDPERVQRLLGAQVEAVGRGHVDVVFGRVGAVLPHLHAPVIRCAEGQHVVRDRRGRIGQIRHREERAPGELSVAPDLQSVAHAAVVLDARPHEGQAGVDDFLVIGRPQQLGQRRREEVLHVQPPDGAGALVAGAVGGYHVPHQRARLGQILVELVPRLDAARVAQQRRAEVPRVGLVHLQEIGHVLGVHAEPGGGADGHPVVVRVRPILGRVHTPVIALVEVQRVGGHGDPRVPDAREQHDGLPLPLGLHAGLVVDERRGRHLQGVGHSAGVLDLGPLEGDRRVEHPLVPDREGQHGHVGREGVLHDQVEGRRDPLVARQVLGHHPPHEGPLFGHGLVEDRQRVDHACLDEQRRAEVPGRCLVQLERVADELGQHGEGPGRRHVGEALGRVGPLLGDPHPPVQPPAEVDGVGRQGGPGL